MISIIITAYNNPDYIHECISSVINSAENYEYEILLGIDNCSKTLNSVHKKIKKYKNLKVFFFPNRIGTYIIRNSLVNESKYENILFFDSDDVMKNNMIGDTLLNIEKYDCIKPMFSGFKDGDNVNLPKFNVQKNTFGEGVFAIKKNVFFEMNGFEPWICAADSEFNWRLRMNNKTFKYIERVCFYYRRHSESLTTNSETGMRSKLRMKYHLMTKNKKNTNSFDPLIEMVTNHFIVITDENIENFLSETEYNEDINDNSLDNNNGHIISLVFNKLPKKIHNKQQIEKQIITSNNPLFEILKKQHKGDIKEKITEKRQNIEQLKQKTNRQVYEELHPKKPNRRLDLPNIRLR